MTRTAKRANMAATHIAMRIGSYQDRQLGKDVIEAHNAVADFSGKVFFGKAGRSLSADKLQLVRDALAQGSKCCLIVIRRSGDQYQCFMAPIHSLPDASFRPDLRLVPEYYHDLAHEIGLWMEIGKFVAADNALIRSLVLASNSRSLLETLDSCRTSLMLVKGEAEE
jgi:hypothetical protein